MKAKRLIFPLLAAILVFSGCKKQALSMVGGPTGESIPTAPTTQPTSVALSFEAQYVRTEGNWDGAKFPGVQVIGSLQELNDYYNTYHEVYDLERREQVSADSTPGFLDACDRYDEAFFETQYLIFVLLEEGSGSVRHQVMGAQKTGDGKVSISINSLTPPGGFGTSDMARWHVIVELSRDALIESSQDVMVYWNDRLAYDGAYIEPPLPASDYKEPPAAMLVFDNTKASLAPMGYSWFYRDEDEKEVAVIADRVAIPEKEQVLSIYADPALAEPVYQYNPDTGKYDAMKHQGYLIKLAFPINPSQITCRPVTEGLSGEYVIDDSSFYALQGEHLYQITVTWEETLEGCHGTADYFVYIHDTQNLYCGNTQTTLHLGNSDYSFMYGNSVTLTDMLQKLTYDPQALCNCIHEFTIDTEFGSNYRVNLTEGYVRYGSGQAALTKEQILTIQGIVDWAKNGMDNNRYYTGYWLDKDTAEKYDNNIFTHIVITEIYENCFFATTVIPMPYAIKLNGHIGNEWCVGDQVSVTYENTYYDGQCQRVEADLLTIQESDWEPDSNVAYKPVIYLYPEKDTEVSVKLTLDGKLTCTYPAYQNGWQVTASPDGTLTDANGQTYNYLYWEGQTNAQWDMSRGFCVKGTDTAAFLEDALKKLGLNRREANEFIVYWLPLMEQNPYNVISFQTEAYTDAAQLHVDPAPDTVIRVFMTWQASDSFVPIPAQALTAPTRTGFTLIEWGGTEIP